MSDLADPDPRPSKRQKTYASNRTFLKSPQGSRTLSSVTNALSCIGNRLLGRSSSLKVEEELHDDSAYGSKEDSVVEDENVVVNGETMETSTDEPDQTTGMEARSTRRSSRKSLGLETEAVGNVAVDGDGDTATQEKPMKVGRVTTKTPPKAREVPTTRTSSRKGAKTTSNRSDNVDSTESTSSTRRNREAKVTVRGATAVEEDVDARHQSPEPEPEPEPKLRSSGLERKKPKKFSPQPEANGKGSPNPTPTKPIASTSTTKPVIGVASPPPKGILTPSKRKRDGPRKSVLFDEAQKEIEEQLGFKDIDTSRKKRQQSKPNHVAETSQHEVRELPTPDEEEIFPIYEPVQDILQTINLPSLETQPPNSDSPLISRIKSHVLSRLTSSSHSTKPPTHLQTQYSTLHALLSSTITASESNSLLLLGSRGSGKITLINTALSNLSQNHPNAFHTVRLNGFLQTDDRLALREIWRQLGREREIQGEISEDETNQVGGSYADTMASLLSLLSHPDDLDVSDSMDVDIPTSPSTSQPQQLNLETSKSVIIILDELDLFTLHPRQTLLYNLFDIAQSRKAPIAVVGTSTRMDVVDMLEKRVKSRFSHRWVHVPVVNSLEGMREVLEAGLCVDEKDGFGTVGEEGGEMEGVGGELENEIERWNGYIKTTFLPSPHVQNLIKQTFYSTKCLTDILAALYIPIASLDIRSTVPSYLACSDKADEPPTSTKATTSSKSGKDTESSRSRKSKGNPKSKPSSSSTPPPPPPTTATITTTSKSLTPNPNPTIRSTTAPQSLLPLLPTLPTLHLSLLISAARLETLYSLPTTNFKATYAHYLSLIARSRQKSGSNFGSVGAQIRGWGREVARAAWEDLVRWGVLVPVSGGGGRGGGGGGGGDGALGSGVGGIGGDGVGVGGKEEIGVRMVRVDVCLDEVAWVVGRRMDGLGARGGGGGGDTMEGMMGRGEREVLLRWCREE